MDAGFFEVVKRDTKYQDSVTLFETCGCDLHSFPYRYVLSWAQHM